MELLLIERSASERTPVAKQLLAVGLRLRYARSSSEARRQMEAIRFDLALIDLSPPDRWARALLEERLAGKHIPMIALVPTEALERRRYDIWSLADDWVSTPVAMPELTTRIQTVAARAGSPIAKTYRAGGLLISPDAGRAAFAGTPITLSQREFSALTLLVRYAPHPIPRQTLQATVYDPGVVITSNAIEAVLSRLRRTLQAAGCPARIIALRGIGWRLTIPNHNGELKQ